MRIQFEANDFELRAGGAEGISKARSRGRQKKDWLCKTNAHPGRESPCCMHRSSPPETCPQLQDEKFPDTPASRYEKLYKNQCCGSGSA